MRKYGQGSIRKRNGIYWVDFRFKGVRYQETTGSRVEHQALQYLNNRLYELNHSPILTLTINDLLDDLEVDYRIGQKMDTRRVPYRMTHLRETFGHYPVGVFSVDIVRKYIDHRLKGGISGATINRDLGLLRRAFSIAKESARIHTIPRIPRLRERNVRTEFFTAEEVERLCRYLPSYLRGMARFAFITGWRKSEIINLTWKDVDLVNGEIRIWESKNGEGRVITINQGLYQILSRQRSTASHGPYVFHYKYRKIGDFKKSWKTATVRVGLSGRTFHDLRRSAIREMSNRGIHRQIAKKITGHKTDSVFNRYHIISEDDIREAMRRLDSE